MSPKVVSERGLAIIREFEGFSAIPYKCPAGHLTIGYGHAIRAGEIYPEEGIDRETAESILKQDVNMAERAICRLVEADLGQNQFDALISLVYNIGIYAFEKSTLLRALNAENHTGAAIEFNRWVYVKKQKIEGLVRRRAAESQLFSSKTVF